MGAPPGPRLGGPNYGRYRRAEFVVQVVLKIHVRQIFKENRGTVAWALLQDRVNLSCRHNKDKRNRAEPTAAPPIHRPTGRPYTP